MNARCKERIPQRHGQIDERSYTDGRLAITINTRSSATAEKQRVSCTHIPRLASWPVDDHAFTVGGSMYSMGQNRRGCIIFWHSDALIHEMLAENGFWHKIALEVIEGHSLCNQLQADKGLHIVLLAVSPKFWKTWPAKSPNIAVVDHPTLIWRPRQEEPLRISP